MVRSKGFVSGCKDVVKDLWVVAGLSAMKISISASKLVLAELVTLVSKQGTLLPPPQCPRGPVTKPHYAPTLHKLKD